MTGDGGQDRASDGVDHGGVVDGDGDVPVPPPFEGLDGAAEEIDAEPPLQLTEWPKDVAPSDDLRRWFAHDAENWEELRQRYVAELDAHPEAWESLRNAAAAGDVMLLYSVRDGEHNNAVVLREYLLARVQEMDSG